MILAILQARVSSTRLPGKVLKPLLGKPMIIRQIERLKHSRRIDHLVVATSNHESDNELFEICQEYDIPCFRGDLDDVLDRFYQVAKLYNPEHIVRITGDCPLIDPILMDEIIEFHINGNYDYTSNTIEPTFPDGLDVEVFKYSCLVEAKKNAKLPSEKEHVTPYIRQNPSNKKGSFKNKIDLSNYRWTVDEPLDFVLVEKIYEALYQEDGLFTTKDVLNYLEKHSELKTLNSMYKRNEGYIKSLEKDKAINKRK